MNSLSKIKKNFQFLSRTSKIASSYVLAILSHKSKKMSLKEAAQVGPYTLSDYSKFLKESSDFAQAALFSLVQKNLKPF
jgi:hypothetical protein